jgi:hypothetical protein
MRRLLQELLLPYQHRLNEAQQSGAGEELLHEAAALKVEKGSI